MFHNLVPFFVDDKGKFKKGKPLVTAVIVSLITVVLYFPYHGAVWAVDDQKSQDEKIKNLEAKISQVELKPTITKQEIADEFKNLTELQTEMFTLLLQKNEEYVSSMLGSVTDQQKANAKQMQTLMLLILTQTEANKKQDEQIQRLLEVGSKDRESLKVLTQNLNTLLRNSKNDKVISESKE